MDKKFKKYLIATFLIVILIIVSVFLIGLIFKKGEISNNIKIKKSTLSDEKKKCLNYNYEIPNNINVLDIISEKEVAIEEDNQLKSYNVESKEYKKIVDINKGFKVNKVSVFNKGIIWCENREKPKIETKIYIKYFKDDKINLLDESNEEILPDMSVSQKYLTYYIVNENKINIKIFNLEDNKKETIASYNFKNGNDTTYVSLPNTNDKNVVWSYSIKEKSNIFKYNIQRKEIETLPTNNVILFNPVIKDNRIIAIKRNDFFDKQFNISYGSNYIVEYDYDKKDWYKFLESKVDNYIKDPKECVIALSSQKSSLLYCLSTFSLERCIYDFSTDKIISLTNEKYIITNIFTVKDKVILYRAKDFEGNKSNFIYIVK